VNIFVGNLSFGAKEADVYGAFAAFGTVGIVTIVLEKKGKKSRGFGFVQMPEEQEALEAIAALNGKELLGRPLNVMPALPKKPKSDSPSRRKNFENKHREDSSRIKPPGNSRHDPLFARTGRYKEGRRSLSFRKRRLAAGVVQEVPARKHKDNPMRWRKKPRWSNPAGKTKEGSESRESKPWHQGSQGARKPWVKMRRKKMSHK